MSAPPRRLASLDLARGLAVLGMIVVNATAGAAALDGPVFPLLLHARWAGFTIADAVFPAFITIMGVSIAVAARGEPGRIDTRHVLARAARLVLLGLVLTNLFFLADFEAFGPPRLPGVLQRIGIVYAAAALLYAHVGRRGRAGLAAAVLLAYWPLCLIPSPDGTPTDLWVQGHNFVSWLDRAVFGSWRYVKGPDGYDPEGLLSTLPTLAEALIGTLAGDWLVRRGPAKGETKVKPGAAVLPASLRYRNSMAIALAAGAGIVLGCVWGLAFPIAKNLWTSSFVLVSAGLTLLVLAGLHAWRDGADEPMRRGGLIGSFGRNAIAAYTLHELAAIILTGDALQLPYRLLAPVTGSEIAALAPVAVFVALIWLPIGAMDRRGWYLKI